MPTHEIAVECPITTSFAVAELVGCVHIDDLRQKRWPFDQFDSFHAFGDLLSHEHTHGPWCWVLTNVRRLESPIACPGRQSLWNLPPEIARQVERLNGVDTELDV